MNYSYEQIEGSMGFPRDFKRERKDRMAGQKSAPEGGGIPRNNPYLPDIG